MSIALSTPHHDTQAAEKTLPGLFVSQEWLANHLDATDLRIIQVGGEKYFSRFHIPGAQLVSYNQIVEMRDGVAGLRRGESALKALFGSLGIAPHTRVVAYDLSGGMDAARLIWTLSTVGHPAEMAVLDGGLGRWYETQQPMEETITTVDAVDFVPQPDGRWSVEAREVEKIAEEGGPALLLDVRSDGEYVGTTRQQPKGHLRGAVHLDWTQTLMNPRDVRLKDSPALLKLFEQVGLSDPNREIIVYCETGHRASQSWLLLRHLGFTQVRLFDGSIAEWRVLGLPVVAGARPE
ncbi:MAG: sulfurtransferase [Magnetococcales bacterium]|nr:sulfurtransferase [Magnetococcales bacterium]